MCKGNVGELWGSCRGGVYFPLIIIESGQDCCTIMNIEWNKIFLDKNWEDEKMNEFVS